jgi:hypothetical protein
MTYREAIQQLQQNIDKARDAANTLRDYAILDEKKFWNNFRTQTLDAYLELGKLDDKLDDNRASMTVRVSL